MSDFNLVQKYSNKLKVKISSSRFINPIVLFALAFILRLIPELMVGKFPIGNDTIIFYAPYVAKFRFDLLNMFCWGHLTSWLLLKFTYVLSGDPYITLKLIGSALYGFLLVSFYCLLISSGWSHKKGLLVSLLLLVQVPALRLSWDLFHNMLGLSFMFFALGELSKISKSEEDVKRFYAKFTIFSILTALTHQMTFFILAAITMFLVTESFSKQGFNSRIRALIVSLMPAFFIFVLTAILPRILTSTASPFQILYKESMMEQASRYFFVNYLDFMNYSEFFNRVLVTFTIGYVLLIPLVIVGHKHEELSSLFKYYTLLTLLCTFSPLITGISLFHWDRWMWLLVFPFCIYAFAGIHIINQRISKLKLGNFAKKFFKVVFMSMMASSFLSLCFVYITRPMSDPFVLYDNFPSKWYLPETLQKTAIPFESISDLEDCVKWLDSNIKGNSCVLFETSFSGFVLLNLTPRSNLTLFSYYPSEFDEAFQESARQRFDFTYLIWWTVYGLPSKNQSVDFLRIYSRNSFSVYARPEHFKPPSLTESTNLLLFDNGTYIEVLDNNKLSASTFTIEFWAEPTSFAKWSRWMGKSIFTSNDKEGWEIMWTDNVDAPSICMVMWNENGIERRSHSVGVALNQWTHIAFTFNGSHIIAYRNGNLDGIIEVGGWRLLLSGEPLRIGKAYDRSCYDGFFATLRFYNRSLSSFEIANNLLESVTKDGLILEFDLIARDSMIMQDLSGAGNNGTILTYPHN